MVDDSRSNGSRHNQNPIPCWSKARKTKGDGSMGEKDVCCSACGEPIDYDERDEKLDEQSMSSLHFRVTKAKLQGREIIKKHWKDVLFKMESDSWNDKIVAHCRDEIGPYTVFERDEENGYFYLEKLGPERS